jgi:hypothetical protein
MRAAESAWSRHEGRAPPHPPLWRRGAKLEGSSVRAVALGRVYRCHRSPGGDRPAVPGASLPAWRPVSGVNFFRAGAGKVPTWEDSRSSADGPGSIHRGSCSRRLPQSCLPWECRAARPALGGGGAGGLPAAPGRWRGHRSHPESHGSLLGLSAAIGRFWRVVSESRANEMPVAFLLRFDPRFVCAFVAPPRV